MLMVKHITYMQIIGLDFSFPCTTVILFSIGLNNCKLHRIEGKKIDNIHNSIICDLHNYIFIQLSNKVVIKYIFLYMSVFYF